MNFTDTLDKTADQIEKPPLLPVGEYVWAVEKTPSIIDKEEWEIVEYQCRCVEPMESVDADALQDFIAKTGALSKQRQRNAFLFSKTDAGAFARTEYNHKQFLTNTLKCWDESTETLKQGMAKSVNRQFIGSIKWTGGEYANLGKTAPLE